jgi:WD40 repeat protein
MYHKQGIEISPLQAYASALIFSPAGSLIRHNFKREEQNWITIKPTIGDKWSACLQTLEGHSDSVNSVAFSHDSTRLASGSNDRTIRIWDAGSGERLQTLEGHSDSVNSVAFSHDSTRLASGSIDRTIRIWDAGSGDCMQILSVNRAPLNISFDTTGSYLHTDYGTVAVDALSALDRTPDTIARQDPRYQGVGLSPNREWITYNSEYLVWLPSDYRPGCSAVSGRTIGIGVGSGKVWICNLNVTGFEHY